MKKGFIAESRGIRMKQEEPLEYDKKIVNRLARAAGHLKSIKAMVEEGRDCSEVLIQIAAVRAAVNGAGKEVLRRYVDQCVEEAMENEDMEAVKKLNKAIDSFLK